jgi:CheY-like chemotaxis protein
MQPVSKLNDEPSKMMADQTGQTLPAMSPGKDQTLTRILIVDDEPAITWLLSEGLAEMADEMASVASGQEALQLLADASFDVLITDYKMPDMDGLILAEHVKRLQPQTSIVMLTAYGSEWLNKRAAEVGIEHVLNKPVHLAEIRRLVSELLKR